MAKIARVGDAISHGGYIVSGASNTYANGQLIARIGDPVICNEHGETKIVECSMSVKVEGSLAARVGDMCGCGAVIVSGSDNVECG
jgi:uncharacterized Zn-binding protein involved in type VI secretion